MRYLLCLATIAAAQPPSAPPPVAPPPVSPARQALARRVAEAGDLNSVLSATGAREIEQIATEVPGLGPEERTQIRRIAGEMLAAERSRLLGALANAYAHRFTEAQLAAIAAFLESSDGRAYIGAFLPVAMEIAPATSTFNLVRDTSAEACRQIHRLCPATGPVPSAPPPPR